MKRLLHGASPRTLLISAGLVVVALLGTLGIAELAAPAAGPAATPRVVAGQTPSSGLPTVSVTALPPEARHVLTLIDAGGPFPYRQDGTVFGNNEGRLPGHPTGYYREYTVPTPGSADRGTRRLVVGHDGDIYYTNDHYASFRQVLR